MITVVALVDVAARNDREELAVHPGARSDVTVAVSCRLPSSDHPATSTLASDPVAGQNRPTAAVPSSRRIGLNKPSVIATSRWR
jgi:hypothetical protein